MICVVCWWTWGVTRWLTGQERIKNDYFNTKSRFIFLILNNSVFFLLRIGYFYHRSKKKKKLFNWKNWRSVSNFFLNSSKLIDILNLWQGVPRQHCLILRGQKPRKVGNQCLNEHSDQNQPCVKTTQVAILVVCCLRHLRDNEIQSRKSSLSNRSVNLKAFQMPKHSTTQGYWQSKCSLGLHVGLGWPGHISIRLSPLSCRLK